MISLKEGANVRLLYHMVIKHFVSKTLFLGHKTSWSDPLHLMILYVFTSMSL